MQLAPLTFLVAEADDFQRRWLCAALAELGAVSIEEAADGSHAFERLAARDPHIDIGFIDLQLPGMDGIELIRRLGDARADAALVLVSDLDPALTSSVSALARACGVDLLGSVDKPPAPEALAPLLRQFRPLSERRIKAVSVPPASEEDLRAALADSQFEPLFQPKVALADGKVHGVEAFARWRHPQHGLLKPEHFLPALERMGEAGSLAWMMVEKSVAAIRRWAVAGYRLPVSINMSPPVLAQVGFAERVAAYLAAQEVAPANLIFEITEAEAVSDVPAFLANLARLRLAGCPLSVDDFGTGQASMQDLMRIPFSEVKIDRSFVAGAAQDRTLEVVLSSTIEMCKKLSRTSVAVGVETQMDWEFLQKLGCVYAQGYYIARPMDAAAIPAWMEEWAQFF